MSSAAAVLRSACYALRRVQNFGARRFHSSGCTVVGKPTETNKAATVCVEDGASRNRKLDELSRLFDTYHALLKEYAELMLEKERARRRKVLVRRTRTIFAGVLAAIYAKHRFFSGTTEDKEMSTGNI